MNLTTALRRLARVAVLSLALSSSALAGIITTGGGKTEEPPPPPADNTTQNDGADSTVEASETSETSGLIETATGLMYSAATGLYYATLSYF